ncbi:MAG TPA: adenylate/guanylate cyclase domain-containing protein [Acidimicrobiales bacterium]|nr:adenylate/guanylate cyclase domain-containing protein [Acidimicrobiales bacterium]
MVTAAELGPSSDLDQTSRSLTVEASAITVLLADDNLIVREGVRALIALEDDLEVVGTASDYEELVAKATAMAPQVVVTDIRMPPSFSREGIEAAQQIRMRHPGTGVVVLSQFDDPEYAISLLGKGSAGYAYLLKDRVAEGDQLARAVRSVAGGGSVIDPVIVDAMVHPVTATGELTPTEEELLHLVAEGRPIKAIAAAQATTPAAAADAVEKLFRRIAEDAGSGGQNSLRRLRGLYEAIVNREEQGETLSRLLPGGVADMLRQNGCRPGETQDLVVSVLMSDIRGYSTIAERTSPSVLARQLNAHRAEMNKAIVSVGGTVMQFVGDAVMAVFGAPVPVADHARKAVEAASAMHSAQRKVNRGWAEEGLPIFDLGIGITTGPVAAAVLGSEEHLEYTLVGDTVNLAQRLQQWAGPGQTVLSEQTHSSLRDPPPCEELPPALVKGREAPVRAWRLPSSEEVTIAGDNDSGTEVPGTDNRTEA